MEKCLPLLTLLPPLLLPREPETGEHLAFSAQGQVGGPRDDGRRKTGSWMGQLSAFTDQETEARRGEGNP